MATLFSVFIVSLLWDRADVLDRLEDYTGATRAGCDLYIV